LVIDSGADETRVTPVYDGTALLTAARRTRCAGNYLTRQYRHILEKNMGVELVPANKIASKVRELSV
jgi:actin-related protein